MIILLVFLSFISVKANTFGGFSPGLDIDHDPRFRNNNTRVRQEVSDCYLNLSNKDYLLNSKNNSLEDTLNFIKATQTGKEIISQVEILIAENKLTFQQLTLFERQRRGLSHKTAALFDITRSIPTIYYDENDELGLLVNFLVHELAHAVDLEIKGEYEKDILLYNKYKKIYHSYGLDKDPLKELTTYQTQIISKAYNEYRISQQRNAYRAERSAFDKQGQFTRELIDKGCFKKYIEEHKVKNSLKLYIDTPDSHIFNSYNIDSRVIK